MHGHVRALRACSTARRRERRACRSREIGASAGRASATPRIECRAYASDHPATELRMYVACVLCPRGSPRVSPHSGLVTRVDCNSRAVVSQTPRRVAWTCRAVRPPTLSRKFKIATSRHNFDQHQHAADQSGLPGDSELSYTLSLVAPLPVWLCLPLSTLHSHSTHACPHERDVSSGARNTQAHRTRRRRDTALLQYLTPLQSCCWRN
jgi:hypothetical protein